MFKILSYLIIAIVAFAYAMPKFATSEESSTQVGTQHRILLRLFAIQIIDFL